MIVNALISMPVVDETLHDRADPVSVSTKSPMHIASEPAG
jgi:hypothetical protein